MIHGSVLSKHGDARALGLHIANDLDWAQEVWSHASLGLLLQELYISPDLMDTPRWDVLSDALRWAREHFQTLEDMHRAVARGCGQEPYGWAAWHSGLGFLTLRNPMASRVKTEQFKLKDALELPSRAQGRLQFEVVRRLVGSSARTWSCGLLQGAKKVQGTCVISSEELTQASLDVTELLILEFRVWSPQPENARAEVQAEL